MSSLAWCNFNIARCPCVVTYSLNNVVILKFNNSSLNWIERGTLSVRWKMKYLNDLITSYFSWSLHIFLVFCSKLNFLLYHVNHFILFVQMFFHDSVHGYPTIILSVSIKRLSDNHVNSSCSFKKRNFI